MELVRQLRRHVRPSRLQEFDSFEVAKKATSFCYILIQKIFPMRTIILLLLFLMSTSSCKENSQIDSYDFVLKRRIILDQKENLASIQSLDINEKGELLVTDQTLKQVILYKNDGSLIKKLSMQDCDPGFQFDPFNAKFHPKGGIFVLHANNPLGTWFKADGTCIMKTSPTLSVVMGIDIGENGDIYAYGKGLKKIQIYDSLGAKKKAFDIEDNFPLANRHVATNSIRYVKNNMYISLPFSSNLLKYTITGQFLGSSNIQHSSLRMAKSDLKNKDDFSPIFQLSLSLGSHKFGNNTLLTFFNSFNVKRKPEARYSVMLLDEDGNQKSFVSTSISVLATHNDQLYAFRETTKQESDKICPKCGGMANPGLAVYDFKRK